MSDWQKSSPSSPLRRSEDDFESTHLLQDAEKHQPITVRHIRDDRNNSGNEILASRRRNQRSWGSLARYALFSALSFASATYYFCSILPNDPSDKIPPQRVAASLCETPECVHAASEILSNLDPNYTNIDPCTDFDQYVCGGWKERYDMRPDQGSIFAGTFMEEAAQTKLRHLLESAKTPDPSDGGNFEKLKAAYGACMDESAIKKLGSKPVDDVLKSLENIYPKDSTLDKGPSTNLTDAIIYLYEIGVEALVSLSPSPDDRDPDSVAIFVIPPDKIGLSAREYYNNTKLVEEYTAVAQKVMGSFIGSKKHRVSDIVAFEKKLADVTPDTASQEDVTKYYNPHTIEETRSFLPQVDISGIITKFAPSDYKTDRLIVGSPSYMKALSSIIEETPRETIQLFFQWKIIQAYADIIEDEKIEPLREFTNILKGKNPKATQERWRKCIGTLDTDLPWLLSRFYVLQIFSEASKKLGDQIVSDIKDRFVFTLDQTSWMSPEVRKLGIQKVANIVQKIGYPSKSPDVMNPEDVEKYYNNLKISRDAYFENVVAAVKFEANRVWSKLGKPTDRDEWEMSAPTVNAYYNPPGNEIVFPAGIMQPPTFYGTAAPLFLSYGAFGAVSGHELSHAFDSTGRHYDETGNFTNWWDDKTIKGFEERAQCFVDQYANFTVPGENKQPLHVNGRLTLGENIADAGGIGAAFHAWKKRDEASPDANLPGLSKFTKEQLFFISYSNWWCSKTTLEAAREAIYNDPHAPKPARILGTMANSREFKEAFNCPVKDPVCKLW